MKNQPEECAHEIIEVIPSIMRIIRNEMQVQRTDDLSVHQFRSLRYMSHHEDVSLSDIATHLGLTLPSTSKMIDGLVHRGVVTRITSVTDRRCVVLTVTENGKSLLRIAHERTQARLSEILAELDGEDISTIMKAMEILQKSFTMTIA